MNIMSLLLLGVLLNAAAQLLLKEGMTHVGQFEFVWSNLIPIGTQVAFNPYIILGITCYVVSVLVWLMVLSRVDVSFAYPMVSIGYIITAVAAYFLLDESISIQRILGILVIIAGVYLVTQTR